MERLKAEGYNWVDISIVFHFLRITDGYIGVCIYGGTAINRAPEQKPFFGAWDTKSVDLAGSSGYRNYTWTIRKPITGPDAFQNDFTLRWWAHGDGLDSYSLETRIVTVRAVK